MLEGLKDYIKVAKEFSEETKEWYNLDEYKHYIATGICGNEYGYGGLDIKWAFHLSPEEIEKCALDEFADFLSSVDNRIEDYLTNIDKKHGTHYAPTGFARLK